MESVYSISVTNKFLLAALDEDEDPIEILKRREQEKEAKRKEKLSEKENRGKDKHEPGHQQQQQPKAQTVASKQQKPKPAKDASAHQNSGPAHQHQRQEQQARGGGQDGPNKRDQDNKKPGYQRNTGERNVKFSAESREEHYNKRNREDGGDRPPRIQNDSRRPYGGEGREPREYREPREFRNSGDRGDFGDRRPGRGGGGGGGERGGRGMGRGGYRGGRGGDRGGRGGYDNRGKREFDRQSGSDKTYGYSGVKSMDKKDGAGSHNWGSHNDEIEDTLNQSDEWAIEKADVSGAAPDANESKDSAGSGAPGEEGGDGAPTEEKPAEEEPKELTLDEWKALQQSRSKPQYNLRKAGEGEDLSRWKKMYALEKKKEDEEDDDEEEYDVAEYPQRAGRQKHVLDIEINFNDSRRGAGGRGGRGGRGRGERGGGRGFGGRGGPRGGGGFDRDRERGDRGDRGDRDGDSRPTEQRSPRERQNAPKVDDEHDFPSLG